MVNPLFVITTMAITFGAILSDAQACDRCSRRGAVYNSCQTRKAINPGCYVPVCPVPQALVCDCLNIQNILVPSQFNSIELQQSRDQTILDLTSMLVDLEMYVSNESSVGDPAREAIVARLRRIGVPAPMTVKKETADKVPGTAILRITEATKNNVTEELLRIKKALKNLKDDNDRLNGRTSQMIPKAQFGSSANLATNDQTAAATSLTPTTSVAIPANLGSSRDQSSRYPNVVTEMRVWKNEKSGRLAVAKFLRLDRSKAYFTNEAGQTVMTDLSNLIESDQLLIIRNAGHNSDIR